MEREGVPSQGLLMPVNIELSPEQYASLNSALEILRRMGFELEPLSGNSVVVKAVPSVMQRGDVKNIVMDLIDQIANSPDKQDKMRLQEEILKTTACHSSVQAGDSLSDAEVRYLLKELFSTNPPYVCPHGRPIIVRMNRYELDEKFLR
jgi:DNA mismatch repair protein MutL